MDNVLQKETAAVLPPGVGRLRCAIYTRKSTEEGLDHEFNSLDAQREAAEAFIFSQRSGGLVALPERYDDGGFTGGNLDRPGLERLLADIRAGVIDCVVVYKVDRLSRSLVDFARIIEIFEAYNVSFVSVTQQFNTTNSLGRLTLNILLSFAQFEREIIAERTRDKVSAARRKGKWIGGRPVLGYDIDPEGSRLTINFDEAFQVRTIFKLYLDYHALMPVVRETHRRGWRTKQWVSRKGAINGGKVITKGRLFRLLTNPIYIGKVFFKEQIYDGEHEAIVDAVTWERAQQILRRNGRNGGAEARDAYGAFLKGLLHCISCNAGMIRTYMICNSRRIRHFVCAQGNQSGHARAVSEAAIKATVVKQIRTIGSNTRIVASTMAKVEQQRQANIADMRLEREVAQRALADMRTQLHKLSAASAVAPEERVGQTERRMKELSLELARLQRQSAEEGDIRTTLSQFDPVWESLNSLEQTRIISALIDRIGYNGDNNKVSVSFRSKGIRLLCRGTAKPSRK